MAASTRGGSGAAPEVNSRTVASAWCRRSSGSAASAAYIGGTPTTVVTRWVSIADSASATPNFGSSTAVAPAAATWSRPGPRP
jgi:hypothetical protein